MIAAVIASSSNAIITMVPLMVVLLLVVGAVIVRTGGVGCPRCGSTSAALTFRFALVRTCPQDRRRFLYGGSVSAGGFVFGRGTLAYGILGSYSTYTDGI
jgi:hypothetical protein